MDAGDNHTPILIDGKELDQRLAAVTADLATALGLVRVLTLLPLYDESLGEVETHLARSWDQLREARRLIEDGKRAGRHLHLVRDPDGTP